MIRQILTILFWFGLLTICSISINNHLNTTKMISKVNNEIEQPVKYDNSFHVEHPVYKGEPYKIINPIYRGEPYEIKFLK